MKNLKEKNLTFLNRQQQEETSRRSSALYEEVTQSFTQDSQVDSLSSDSEGVTLNVQDLLLEAYRQIGDPDGVYGCGAGRLADPVSRSVKIQFSTMYNESMVWEFLVNSPSPLSHSRIYNSYSFKC